jgi:hypothetical protein
MANSSRSGSRARAYFVLGPLFGAEILIAACIPRVTPHENFLNSLRLSVGRDIRNHVEFAQYQRKILANGNYEFRMTRPYGRRRGPCTTIYEVDPISYKILRSDFIGSKEDCIIPP